MASVFLDYQEAVLADYRLRWTGLSSNLKFPKAAKLRDECELVCSERFLLKDDKAIRDFFGKGGDKKSCLDGIKFSKADKLKPVMNFLNGDTAKPEEKVIELLAWLIDFPRRPFNPDIDYLGLIEVNAGTVPEDDEEGNNDEGVLGKETVTIEPYVAETKVEISSTAGFTEDEKTGSRIDELPAFDQVDSKEITYADKIGGSSQHNGSQSKPPSRKIIVVGLLVFVLGGGAYAVKEFVLPPPPPSSGSCMYWIKDHYEQIPCNQKMSDRLVLALDTARLNNFRMLTHKDSVIKRGVGLVWYSKIDNDVQFYTGDGRHPVVYSRRLKPATQYIIDKYAAFVKAPD